MSEIPTASLNTMNSVTPSIDSQIKSKGKKKKQLSKKPVSKAINSSNTKSSFFYEKNKMLFVSRVVDLLNKHGMEVPEDLLDNSEFIPKFFKFLEGHNIHLPALDIPKFKTIKTQDTNEIQRIKVKKPDNSVSSSDDEEN